MDIMSASAVRGPKVRRGMREAVKRAAAAVKAPGTARTVDDLPKIRVRPNLYELASTLPNGGLGSTFAKRAWMTLPERYGETFWRLTRVRTRPSGRSGEAYGVLTWKGRDRGVEERINGSMKPIWSVLTRGTDGGGAPGPTLSAPPPSRAETETSD